MKYIFENIQLPVPLAVKQLWMEMNFTEKEVDLLFTLVSPG